MNKHIVYHRLGDYYGRKRIYLETRLAAEAGFCPGARFSIAVDETQKQLTIVLDDRGPRTVSRRTRASGELPVIDIRSASFDDIAHAAERARVEFGEGRILVTLHRDHFAEGERRARLASRLASGAPLHIISLCSGAGILDNAIVHGLCRAGIGADVRFAVDVDERALQAALDNNEAYRSAAVAFGRIEDVERWPQADLLIAGLPCVGAAPAGRAARHGAAPEEHPDAGALYLQFILAVAQANPAVVCFENVSYYKGTESAAAIKAFLRLRGYDVHERVLVGSEFGDLERRARLCLVAVTRGIDFNVDAIVPVRERPQSVGAVLEDIAIDSSLWQTRAHLAVKLARDVAKGNNFRAQPITAASEVCPVISAGYTRWRTTDPRVPHPSGDGRERLLTVREHAAVKGIPLHLLSGLTEAHAHQVLGNAVTYHAWVAVGTALGNALRRADVLPSPQQLAFA